MSQKFIGDRECITEKSIELSKFLKKEVVIRFGDSLPWFNDDIELLVCKTISKILLGESSSSIRSILEDGVHPDLFQTMVLDLLDTFSMFYIPQRIEDRFQT